MATWDLENAAHLLRRAAFGGSPDDIQSFFDRHNSVAEAVDELSSFAPSKRTPPKKNDTEGDSKLKMQRWWLKTMAKANHIDATREKLVLFYHNFLVSGADKQPILRYLSVQNGLFRLLGKGSFKDLIREFNSDPANLYYLDGILNDARNDDGVVIANENWGRELLELFTLGPFQFAADGSDDPTKPNYSEADVHNMARASTGWIHIFKDKGVFDIDAYDGGQYDDDGDSNPDDIVIFGVANNNFRFDGEVVGTADDVLDLVFARQDDAGNNQAAMFVARKVWEWYGYPPPLSGLKAHLATLASAFEGSDFDMETLLRTAWNSDEFYSSAAKSRTVKNPVDYVLQATKRLHVRGNGRFVGDAPTELGDFLASMGMDLFQPPNVAGWPGSLSWITSGTLIERLRFARYQGAADFGAYRIKIKNLEKIVLGSSSVPVADVVDQVVEQLGLDQGPLQLTQAQKDLLAEYASNDGALTTLDLSNEFTDDVQNKLRGLIAMALQTAEAQLF